MTDFETKIREAYLLDKQRDSETTRLRKKIDELEKELEKTREELKEKDRPFYPATNVHNVLFDFLDALDKEEIK